VLTATAAMDLENPEKNPLTMFEILLILIALFLAGIVIITISNVFHLKSITAYPTTDFTPFVSILVPARNEEESIADCVTSLLAQDYANYEIIVMDDDSTDSTQKILVSLAAKDNRLKIEKGTPLPPGWLGKHWTCHQLSQKASGELLLFTDADTMHKPQMLRQAVSAMTWEQAALISALPRQRMVSFAEKLIMPFSYWSIMTFLPLGLAYQSRISVLSTATGQFMLFHRSAYDQIGGFTAVKDHVVDDVELCKRVQEQGLCWRLLDGKDAYEVRQYKSFKEIYEGHTKNLFAGFASNILVFSAVWLWLLLVFWLPLMGLGWSLSAASYPMILWVSIACIAISLLIWVIAYARFGFPLYLVIFYPVIVLLMVYIAAGSMSLNLTRKAKWKGRYILEKL
jgi:chlorobactene glucosyltransferase